MADETPPFVGVAGCAVCGALVANDPDMIAIHESWHARLSGMYEALAHPFGGSR